MLKQPRTGENYRYVDSQTVVWIDPIPHLEWEADNEKTLYLCPSFRSNTSWPGLHTDITVAATYHNSYLDKLIPIENRCLNINSINAHIHSRKFTYIFWSPHLSLTVPLLLISTMAPHFWPLNSWEIRIYKNFSLLYVNDIVCYKYLQSENIHIKS